MARDGLAPKTPDRANAPRPDERPEPVFGPLRGGAMIHWMVQERRS